MTGIDEADRQRVVDELRRRAAVGLLSAEDLDDRLHRAQSVLTHAGLEGILLDLPTSGAGPSPRPWAPPGATADDDPSTPAPRPLQPGPIGAGRAWWQRPTTVAVLAVIVVAATVLAVTAIPGGDPGDDPPPAATTPTPASTAPAVPVTEATVPPEPTSSTTATTSVPGPDDPVALIVGRDIQPGRHVAEALTDYCGWERVLTDEEGHLEEFRGAAGSGRRTVMDVLPTDSAVVVRGCSPWRPYAPPATPATTITDGDWLVGGDIVPGHYVATELPADEYCSWSRSRSFTGDGTDSTDSGSEPENPAVDLLDGEAFSTGGCGTWILQ